jgi:transposase
MSKALSVETLDDINYQLRAGLSVASIHDATGVSQKHIRTLRRRLYSYGTIKPLQMSKMGRPSILTAEMLADIRYLQDNRPSIYLEELQYFLFDHWELWVSESTICRAIKASGNTRKVLQRVAAQRSTTLRAEYWLDIQTIPVEYFVTVDESAVSEKHFDRKYGYSPRGTAAVEVKELRRTERYSLLPAYTVNGFLAGPLIVKSAVDGDLFVAWLRETVLPQMNAYPGPRSVLIMDNCSTHRVAVSITSTRYLLV